MTVYSDDPTIGDDEALLRGIRPEYMNDAPGGAVSHVAFVLRQNEDHLSVFRELHCEPMRLFKKTLGRSKALGRLIAGPVRQLKPVVAGIGRDTGISLCHAYILRPESIEKGDTQLLAVAQRLAALCEISHMNPKNLS
jgi:hypothetical protein